MLRLTALSLASGMIFFGATALADITRPDLGLSDLPEAIPRRADIDDGEGIRDGSVSLGSVFVTGDGTSETGMEVSVRASLVKHRFSKCDDVQDSLSQRADGIIGPETRSDIESWKSTLANCHANPASPDRERVHYSSFIPMEIRLRVSNGDSSISLRDLRIGIYDGFAFQRNILLRVLNYAYQELDGFVAGGTHYIEVVSAGYDSGLVSLNGSTEVILKVRVHGGMMPRVRTMLTSKDGMGGGQAGVQGSVVVRWRKSAILNLYGDVIYGGGMTPTRQLEADGQGVTSNFRTLRGGGSVHYRFGRRLSASLSFERIAHQYATWMTDGEGTKVGSPLFESSVPAIKVVRGGLEWTW